MSKKYYDRLLEIAPSSSLPIKCKFGMSILKKLGWTEGKGLGKYEEGRTECLKVEKRTEFLGLGAEDKKSKDNVWSNWWEGMYDEVAKKLSFSDDLVSENESTASTENSENLSSGDTHNINRSRRHLQGKKLKRIQNQDNEMTKEKEKMNSTSVLVNAQEEKGFGKKEESVNKKMKRKENKRKKRKEVEMNEQGEENNSRNEVINERNLEKEDAIVANKRKLKRKKI